MLLQRGDQEMAPNKHPNLRLWDGMVGYLDPQDWSERVTFSDYWLGETCVVELPRTWKPMLLEANKSYESVIVGPSGFPITGDTTRRTRGYIDIPEVAPFVQATIPDFTTKYYKHKTYLPVIKGDSLPLSLVKDTKGVDFTARTLREDVGQITIGNFTVGPVGADYLLFGGVGGAWAALGNLTGNLTFTLIGSINDNQLPVCVITLGGFTLDNTSNNPHGGDPTAGWQITVSVIANYFDMQQEGPGTFNMRHLRTVRAVNGQWDYVIRTIGIRHTINLHDLLIDHGAKNDGCFLLQDATPDVYVWNCNMYNSAQWLFNIGVASGRATNIYENNNCYDAIINSGMRANNNPGIFRNNAVWNSGGADFENPGAATGRYNLSSDATAANVNWLAGAGNIINTAAALCVQGVNPAVANFLDILAAGPLDGAGEVNALARPTCIRTRAVPGPTGTSIGSAEIPPAEPPEPTPTPTPTPAEEERHRRQYWRRMMAGKLTP